MLPCSLGAPQVPLSQFIYIPPCAESDTIEKYVQITIVFHLLLIEGGWTIIMSIKGQLVILSTPTDPQFVHSCLIIFHSEMARAEIILAIRCLVLCSSWIFSFADTTSLCLMQDWDGMKCSYFFLLFLNCSQKRWQWIWNGFKIVYTPQLKQLFFMWKKMKDKSYQKVT